jgi:metal-responsive CopG/Arc/MetJ family transcriptional regulator
MPKKVLIALPPAMLEQVDFIAQCEHRTRSDLIREALRRYLDNFRRTQGGAAHLSVSTMEVSENYSAIGASTTPSSST